MKKWLRASVALLALVAMLAENTFSVYAAMDGYTSPEETVSEAEQEPEVVLEETSVSEEIAQETEDTVADDTDAPEEAAEEENTDVLTDTGEEDAGAVSASVESLKDCLRAEGVDDFTFYINTDDMNESDHFKLAYTDGVAPFMDDALFGTLTKENCGIYNVSGLQNEVFEIWVGTISEGMEVEYSTRDDDYVQITLKSRPEAEVEKKLEADESGVFGVGYNELHISINTADLPDDTYYALHIDTDAAVKYDGETLQDNVITTLSNRVEDIYLSNLDKKGFELYVTGESTDEVGAEYYVESVENGVLRMSMNMNGSDARKNRIVSLKATAVDEEGEKIADEYTDMELPEFTGDVLTLDDPENPPYEVTVANESGKSAVFEYVRAEVNGKEITAIRKTEATDEETGETGSGYAYTTNGKHWVNFAEDATINVVYRGSSKAVYTYEDDKVKIRVALEDASDLPDNAVLHADEITPESDPEHFQEVGDQISAEIPEEKSLQEYCIYDVYFTVDEEEVEPANAVSVNIVYKEQILSTEGETPAGDEEIMAFHLEEDGNGEVVNVEDISSGAVTDAEGNVERLDFETESFSEIVAAIVGGSDTFISNGGSYSLYYVLNNLNYFVRNNVEANHTVGSVVVGGNATINTMGNANKAQSQKIPSYIKGLAKTGNIVTDQYIYLGTVNKNNSQTQVYGTKGIKYTDNYVDFDAAFAAFEAEMNGISCEIRITDSEISNRRPSSSHVKIENNYWRQNTVKLDAGHSYVFDSFNGVGIIDIQGSATSSADTVIKVNSSGTVGQFPLTMINGSYAGSNENGIGCSLTFLFPSATSLKVTSPDTYIGHIVAPKASVVWEGSGNYNGCIIAKSLKTGAEGHMWPYNGSIFTPSETGFEAVKTVEGQTPKADEKFTFILEEWKNNKWVQRGNAVENDGSKVAFPKISYGENDAGDHYYRITEEQKAYTGYTIDTTQYIVKVKVENHTNGNVTTQTATETYYKCGAVTEVRNSNKVTSMTFDNKTTSKTPYDFIVKKYFDKAGEDWPDGATFKFKMVQFDGGQANEGSNIKTGPLPELTYVKNGNYCQLELTKDNREGTFGTIYFEAYPYENENTSCHYTADWGTREIWCRTIMYKITEEVENPIPGMTYDTQPIYLKLFVNTILDKITNTYSVVIEDHVSRTNEPGSCHPHNYGPFEFTNKYTPGSLKIKKVALDSNNQTADSDKDFYVAVYSVASGKRTYYGIDGTEYEYPTVHVEKIKGNSEIVYKPLPVGLQYYVYETDENGNAITSSTEYEVTYSGLAQDNSVQITDKHLNKEVTVTNKKIPKGILKLNKKGGLASESPIDLSGVTFYLYESDHDPVYVSGSDGKYTFADRATGALPLVTDKDGNLSVEGLPLGNYYIQEISLPATYANGFVQYGDPISFEVKKYQTVLTSGESDYVKKQENGVELKLTVYNKRVPAAILIEKYIVSNQISGSANNQDVEGYVFYLYDDSDNGKLIDTVTTGKDGKASFAGKLVFGHTYRVEEDAAVAASKGTILNSIAPKTFTIDNRWYENAETQLIGKATYIVKKAIVNNKEVKGKIRLIKTNAEGATITEGKAKFVLSKSNVFENENDRVTISGSNGVYKQDLTKTDTYMETVNGELTVEELTPGTYYFFEIASPDTNKYTFTRGQAYGFTIDALKATADKAVIELISDEDAVKVQNGSFNAVMSFSKVDAYNVAKKLSDQTQFTLYATNTLGGAITGDAIVTVAATNGLVKVPFAKAGTYVLVETKTETGYMSQYDGDALKIYLEVKPDQDKKTNLTLKDVGAFATQNGRTLTKEELVDTAANHVKNEPVPGKVTLQKRFVDKDGKEITASSASSYLLGEANFTLYTNSPEFKKRDKRYENQINDLTKYVEYGKYSTVNRTLTVNDLPWGDYYFQETGTVQQDGKTVYIFDKDEEYHFTIGENSDKQLQLDVNKFVTKGGKVVELIDNTIVTGSAKIVKRDADTDKGIANVRFELYRVKVSADGQTYTVLEQIPLNPDKTAADGSLAVTDLEFGKYYFIESANQDVVGYDFDTTTKYFFDINENNKEVTNLSYIVNGEQKTSSDGVIKNNPQKGTVSLDKWAIVKDTTDDPEYLSKLAGAKFELYSNNTTTFGQSILALFNDETKHYLYKADGNGTYVTDASGTITVTGLPWGTYYFVETEAPQGYSMPEDVNERTYYFTIDGAHLNVHIGRPEGNVVNNELSNKVPVNERLNGALKLTKKNDETGKGISGVPFRLFKDGADYTAQLSATLNRTNKQEYTFREDGHTEELLITDANGVITVEELPWGTYYFKEAEIPEGFTAIKTDSDQMVINASNARAEAAYDATNSTEMFNTPIKGDLLLKKVDEAGNALKGATFDLVRVDSDGYRKVTVTGAAGAYTYAGLEDGDYRGPSIGKQIGDFLKSIFSKRTGDLSTNDSAVLTVDKLPYGHYEIYEITPPDGYEPKKDDPVIIRAFDIDGTKEDGHDATVTFVNTKIYAGVQFVKTVEGKELTGASFVLQKKNGTEYENYNVAKAAKDKYYKVDDPANTVIGTFNSVVTFSGLPVGEYRIFEVSDYEFAPDAINQYPYLDVNGKEIWAQPDENTKFYMFSITADDSGVNNVGLDNADGSFQNYYAEIVKNTPKPGRAKLMKMEGTTAISGAKFALYHGEENNGKYSLGDPDKDTRITEIVSENGEVYTPALNWGSYYLVETETSDRTYFLEKELKDRAQYHFTIGPDAEGKFNKLVTEFTVLQKGKDTITGVKTADNKKIKGQAEFTKLDADTLKMIMSEQITFDLYYKATENAEYQPVLKYSGENALNAANGWIRTDKDLKAGYYYFVEITTADGYEPLPEKLEDRTKYKFEIKQAADAKTEEDFEIVWDGTMAHTDDGKPYVSNTPLPGSVKLFKYYVLDTAEKPLASASFVLTGKTEKGETKTWTQSSGMDGVVAFTNIPWGTYSVKEVKTPAGYKLPDGVQLPENIVINADKLDYTYESESDETLKILNERKKGKLDLKKVDDKGNPVPGVGFELQKKVGDTWTQVYNPENPETGYYVTGEGGLLSIFNLRTKKGAIEIKDLEWGQYRLIEREVPEGIMLKDGFIPDENGVYIGAENMPDESHLEYDLGEIENKNVHGNIGVRKVDDKAKGLSGAEFVLFQAEGTNKQAREVYVKQTSAGVYAYVSMDETKAKETEGYTKTLVSPGEEGNIGRIKVTGLPCGTYYMQETKEPDPVTVDGQTIMYTKQTDLIGPYVIDTDQTAEDTEKSVDWINTPGDFQADVIFYKTDDARTGLNGVVYRITNKDNGMTWDVESQAVGTMNGVVRAKFLATGTYTIQEFSTPDDAYQLDPNVYQIEIKATDNGRLINLSDLITVPADSTFIASDNTFVNKPSKGSVKLIKLETESSGEDAHEIGRMNGVTFKLYKVEKSGRVPVVRNGSNEFVTATINDESGVITVSDLDWGTYVFVEEVPKDHESESTPAEYTFTINRDTFKGAEKIEVVTARNRRIPGSLTVQKFFENPEPGFNGEGVIFTLDLVKGTSDITDEYSVRAETKKDPKGNYFVNFTQLPWGIYTLTEDETTVKTGYIPYKGTRTVKIGNAIKSATYEQKIDAEGLHVDLIGEQTGTIEDPAKGIVNEKIKGSVNMQKVESVYQKPVVASFKLYKGAHPESINTTTTGLAPVIIQDVTDEYGVFTTDANGKFAFPEKSLEYGSYYLEESVPEGYEGYADGAFTYQGVHFEITTDQTVQLTKDSGKPIINTPLTGSVKLQKKDENGKPIKGVTFKLYAEDAQGANALELLQSALGKLFKGTDGTLYATRATDENGMISITGLPWGTYHFEEIVPKGYTLTEEEAKKISKPFIIGEQNDKVELSYTVGVVVNETIPGSLKLYKKGYDKITNKKDVPLAGALFSLYRVNGKRDTTPGTAADATDLADDCLMVNLETSSDQDKLGVIEVPDLAWGQYYFVETKAPEGYDIVEETLPTMTIGRTSETGYTDVTLSISDDELSRLLYPEINVNNKKGYGYTALYKIFEMVGREEDNSALDLRVEKDGRHLTFEIYSADSEGNAVGSPVAANYGTYSGTEFPVYQATMMTDVIGPLPYGKYVYVEKSTPDGVDYVVDSAPKPFEIDSTCTEENVREEMSKASPDYAFHYVTPFENTTYRGWSKIAKTDMATGAFVAGVSFYVYKVNTEADGKLTLGAKYSNAGYTTASNGVAVVTGLPLGKYAFIEDAESAKALGYKASENAYVFEVTEDTATNNAPSIVKEALPVKEGDKTVAYELTNHEVQAVPNERLHGSISLLKKGINGTALAGATFNLWKVEGNRDTVPGVASTTDLADVKIAVDGNTDLVTDENGRIFVDELEWGSYYFDEIIPPKGYTLLARPNHETKTIDGSNVTVQAEVSMEDTPIEIDIAKTDITGQTELSGAKMAIYAVDSETPLISWTSDKDAEKRIVIGDGFEGLSATLADAETPTIYILRETMAPEGYTITADIYFSVDAYGNIQLYNKSEDGKYTPATPENAEVKVVTDGGAKRDVPLLLMKDDATTVKITKRELGTTRYLPGATLAIYDAENYAKIKNNIAGAVAVDTWTTGEKDKEEAHPITGKLLASNGVKHVYYLVETKVPEGYYQAAPIAFTVNNKNEIELYSAEGDATGQVTEDKKMLIMYDRPIFVKITKKDTNKIDSLPGAKLNVADAHNNVDVTFVTTDKPALLVPVSESEAAASGTKYTELAKLYQLVYDAKLNIVDEYTLTELEAPEGYQIAAPQKFTVVYDKDLGLYETDLIDEPIKLYVSKRSTIDDKELAGADMAIYERDANAPDEIGDKVISWKSSSKEYLISIKDKQADDGVLKRDQEYWLVEDASPAGYALAAKIPFKVNKDGSIAAAEYGELNEEQIPRIIMKDEPLALIISKENADHIKLGATDSNENRTGAKLELRTGTQENATVLASWTSDGKIAFISEHAKNDNPNYTQVELKAGQHLRRDTTYYVYEVEAPMGYEKAEKPLEVKPMKLSEANNSKNAFVLINNKFGLTHKDGTKTWNITPELAEELKEQGAKIFINLTRYYENPKGEKIYVDSSNNEVAADKPHPILATKTLTPTTSKVQYSFDELEPYHYDSVTGRADPYVYDVEEDLNGLEDKLISKKVIDGIINTQRYKRISGDKKWILFRDESGEKVLDFDNDETLRELLTKYGKNNKSAYVNVDIALATVDKDGNTTIIDEDHNGKADYCVTITYGAKEGEAQVEKTEPGEGHIVINWTKPGEVKFAFEKLPAFDANYNEIMYAFVEQASSEDDQGKFQIVYSDGKAYGTDGTLITNKPLYDPFTIRGQKLWKDPYAKTPEKRPEVTIQLYRDGQPMEGYSKTLTAADNYRFEFKGLYEFDLDQKMDGHRYNYEIRELGSTGDYAIEIDFNGKKLTMTSDGKVAKEEAGTSTTKVEDGVVVKEATVTNKINPQYISIDGSKEWVNEDKTKVPEITINLYRLVPDQDGKLIKEKNPIRTATMKNAADNKYEFKDLPKFDESGQLIIYKVEEDLTNLGGYTSTPADGYTITPDADKTLVRYTGNVFENRPSYFRVRKTEVLDGVQSTLAGATMRVIDKNKKEIDRWVTTETDDHYVEGLVFGETYTLEEVEAPKGYLKIKPYVFTVDESFMKPKDEIEPVIVDDPKITGSLTLTKRDATTRETLAGAEFTLYDSANKAVHVTGSSGDYKYTKDTTKGTTLAVNSSGTLKVTELPCGTYYFKETKAPKGYVLKTTTEKVTLTEDSYDKTVTFLNEQSKGTAELHKTNSSGTSLAGAVFELYSATPKTAGQAAASTIYSDAYYRYGTYTTGSDGIIRVTGLPWDDYYFIETKAPSGYKTNVDVNGDPLVYPFSIDSSNATASIGYRVTVTNDTDGGGGGGGGEYESTITSDGGGGGSAVAGVRRKSTISDVLGVRAKPTSGVLGVRVGPVTGDAANIALWLLLLVASISMIVVICIQNHKRKKRAA